MRSSADVGSAGKVRRRDLYIVCRIDRKSVGVIETDALTYPSVRNILLGLHVTSSVAFRLHVDFAISKEESLTLAA
jgi:hypothetical protein